MFRWAAITFALPALIVADLAMIAVAVVRYPALFSQPGARTFIVEPICALCGIWANRKSFLLAPRCRDNRVSRSCPAICSSDCSKDRFANSDETLGGPERSISSHAH